ncbi:V-type ATP synthase subunit F [Ruminococcaceae bacterium OttesenSCG-928-A11]|nr:V-type ATP synthase subunit F [Ruminococcaceae bacterium OttesenSCG-928-A11]
MYKIAVMGDRDSIYGFASVGLDIFPVDAEQSVVRQVKNLTEQGYAIIYMTEKLFSASESELDVFNEAALPAIIPIPGVSGNTGLGIARVKKSVEKAVGSDIIFGSGS